MRLFFIKHIKKSTEDAFGGRISYVGVISPFSDTATIREAPFRNQSIIHTEHELEMVMTILKNNGYTNLSTEEA